MGRKNIQLLLAYEGGRYHGWQRQQNAVTIQEVLEDRLQQITGRAARVTASGRTDAGVHAWGQVCNFFSDTRLLPETLLRALNALLPPDIQVREARYVSRHFHARYSARSKTYAYMILNRPLPDIFSRRHEWHIARPLDLAEMKACLPLLLGTHDFSAFQSSGGSARDPVRTITRCTVELVSNGRLQLVVTANGFLRHMVRNLVGTLVDVGLKKTTPEKFLEILASGDRSMAGPKAPPEGLFLMEVWYPSAELCSEWTENLPL